MSLNTHSLFVCVWGGGGGRGGNNMWPLERILYPGYFIFKKYFVIYITIFRGDEAPASRLRSAIGYRGFK